MVLGMLALLVLMGVTFVISMRTERLAARSYLDVTKARQHIHTALARVLSEIELEMDGLSYPPWDAHTSAEYGWVRVDQSTALMGAYPGGDRTPMAHVPGSLRDAAMPPGWSRHRFSWLELRDSDNQVRGEYTYLIVNNSGLLDANYIGEYEADPQPRRRGFDVGEIRFHHNILPECRGGIAHRHLRTYRDAFVRFESVPELHLLASGRLADYRDQLGRPAPLHWEPDGSVDYVSHLHVFSRYPAGYVDVNDDWNAVNDVVYIGGNPDDWDEDDIRAALAGIVPDRDAFINAMYDYADDGLIPRELEQFTTKPVPLINEIVLEVSAEPGADPDDPSVIITATLKIETAYLFPNEPTGTFTVEVDDVTITVAGVDLNFTRSGPDPATIDLDEEEEYFVTEFVFEWEGVPPPDIAVDIVVELDGDGIEVRHDGTPVDRVLSNWPADAFLVNLDLAAGNSVTTGWSANDPRINWDPSNADHWQKADNDGEITLGEQNHNRFITGNPDERFFMFAARRPFESVGELGYLLYDAEEPWTTVRFIGDNADNFTPLFDRFIVHEEPVRRGLVNVNTRQTNTLVAAFWDMPVERYPEEDPDGPRLDNVAALRTFAGLWMDATTTQGGLNNLSDFSDILDTLPIDALLNSTDDKFKRESLLRNSLGLLGVRHNLFTIFIEARVFAEGYNADDADHYAKRNDFVTGEESGIAVVWRDPYRVNGVHQTRVKFFHY